MSVTILDEQTAIRARLDRAAADLRALQRRCPHTKKTKTAHSNAGNYDPSADHYWFAFDCPDCGKRWTEDQ